MTNQETGAAVRPAAQTAPQINNSEAAAEPSAAPETSLLNAPSVPAQTPGEPGSAPENSGGNQPQTRTDAVQDPPSYDIQFPEDFSVRPEALEAFKRLAREISLTEEQAQKLADYEVSLSRKGEENAAEEKRQTLERWAAQTKRMYGAKLEEEISFALRAADAFGGPDFRALLEDTGLGNHPVIIRTLSGIGRRISEDAFPGGKPSAPRDKTFAEALYGKNN